MAPQSFEIIGGTQAISCLQYGAEPIKLVFTHGAGGTLNSEAMINFSSGFATVSPMICFKGSMNLSSRTKSFKAVLEDERSQSCAAFGGRSMGARAAVMAATESIKFLILVSYPLRSEKGDLRDKILLDIPVETKVLFISGDKDQMCDLKELNVVRRKMQCQTWLVQVRDADHGMNVKPKRGTNPVGIETGRVAAEWLREQNAAKTDWEIYFSTDENGGLVKETAWEELEEMVKTHEGAGNTKATDLIAEAKPNPKQVRPFSEPKPAKKRSVPESHSSGIRRSSRLKAA